MTIKKQRFAEHYVSDSEIVAGPGEVVVHGPLGSYAKKVGKLKKAGPIERPTIEVRHLMAEFVSRRLSSGLEFLEEDGLLKLHIEVVRAGELDEMMRSVKGGPPKGNPQRVIGRNFSVLAKTSKMGCWSFNLPAGPKSVIGEGKFAGQQQLGTCPAAGLGFVLNSPEQHQSLKKSLYVQQEVKVEGFLCSSCYALKGAYAYPSTILSQELRRQMTERLLAAGNGAFEKVLIRAIRLSQIQSTKARRMSNLDDVYTLPHPEYFRIHDAGDFYSPEYFRAWMNVCRHFLEPDAETGMPAVNFWAPTRMWAVNGPVNKTAATTCLSAKDLACVPPNLALRPSALHFGDKAPMLNLPGYSAGSAATTVDRLTEVADFTCPAYLPPTVDGRDIGGGAELKKGKWVGGTCQRAWGKNGAKPAPEGPGCRMCWTGKSTSVVYSEH